MLSEMKENITARLRDFWDAGIRGPDFVWGRHRPALEAFSKHPVVRVTDTPNQLLTVAEFLREVRRMVVAFVVSRMFGENDASVQDLDDPTTYYLLHRSDFGLGPAPAGACILYAVSCNLSDADLAGRQDILLRGRGRRSAQDEADAPPPCRLRQRSPAQALEPPPLQDPGRTVVRRRAPAPRRLRAQAHAALEDRRAVPRQRLPGHPRPLAPRTLRQGRAGPDRAGPRRLRRTRDP